MRHAFRVPAAALLLLGGCASGEGRNAWLDNRSHFASKDHMVFSARNVGERPRVTRADLARSRAEGWWGAPVTVDQAQFLER